MKAKLLNRLRDSHTIPWNCPKPSPWELIWQTFRYRLAALGVYLSPNERRLANLKDCHRYQRAFILGNGPSLNHCDLKLLKNEITFGVNSIFLNFDNMGFYPTYYVVEDVFVAEDRTEEINCYRGPKKFFGNYLKYCVRDDPSTIWLNVRFRYDNYPGFPHFSKNALRMVWTGGTVTYLCLQLAYYMGFSEIFLVGFDHKYVIPPKAIVSGTEILSTSADPNHFSLEYFGQGYRWHDPMVERMEAAYKKADKAFRSDNRKIINATKGGQLEIFERVGYENLLK
jgi:hypothetical protein